MSNIILLKRSSTPGAAPTTSNLSLGEIAANTYDGLLYTKVNNGSDLVRRLLTEPGSGSVTWRAIGGDSPVDLELNGDIVSQFTAAGTQELYTWIKVPYFYVTGRPIKINVPCYSASATGTILMQAQSTLIRNGTDAVTSTTNQRTTTNSAITNTLANKLVQHVLDITDSTGKINSVAVSSSDLIKVRLYRGTDTDTAVINVVAATCEAVYS